MIEMAKNLMKDPVGFARKYYISHKETIDNFFWRSLQIFGKQGISFLIFLITANYLMPEEFGLLSYIMAVAGILMIFSDFGISTATSKYVAEYAAKKDKRLDTIAFSVSMVVVGLATAMSLVVVLFGKALFAENYTYMLWLLPYIFFYPLTAVLDGYYRGSKQFRKLAVVSMSVGLAGLAASFLLIPALGIVGSLLTQDIMYAVMAIVMFLIMKGIVWKIDKPVLKKVLKYSLIIGVTSLMYYFYTRVDIIIMKHFGFIVEIGYYDIVTRFFALVIMPFMILGQVIAPNITAHYAAKRFKVIEDKFIKHVVVIGTGSILLSIALYFIFPFAVKFFFNKYYTEATLLMFNLLLLTLPLKIVAAVVNHGHTVPTENAHFSMWTMIPAAIANIVLDFLFMSWYGYIGVIYASIICFTWSALSLLVLYFFKIERILRKTNMGSSYEIYN